MAKNKQSSLPPEEQEQVQKVLAQYHEIAQRIMGAKKQGDYEQALSPLTTLPENVQIATLKALSGEKSSEAADVLAAMYEFSPQKEARKEARRSLIRLEGAKVYPRWEPKHASMIDSLFDMIDTPLNTAPPRYWRGFYTDTRDAGEIQLLLFWEQGERYKEARMMGFLLDFWDNGVKDFFTEVHSKRHMEKHIEEVRSHLVDIDVINCTLAEARQLLMEALAVNEKNNVKPHSDYLRSEALVKNLVLDAPEGTDDEDLFAALAPSSSQGASSPLDMLNSLLPPEARGSFESFFANMVYQEVLGTFFDTWSEGNFEAAYDLLASDSPLRDGLERNEWVNLRQQWRAQAQPTSFEPTFISEAKDVLAGDFDEDLEEDEDDDLFDEDIEDEVEEDEDTLDLDDEDEEAPVMEAGWSLQFIDTPLAQQIKELPRATAFYSETGRHWFWSSYTLKREDDGWHIYDMHDLGAEAMQLSQDELEERLDAIRETASIGFKSILQKAGIDPDKDALDNSDFDRLDELVDNQGEEPGNAEITETLERLQAGVQLMIQGLHYYDAWIANVSDHELSVYSQAADSCATLQDFERAMIYLKPMIELAPEQRGDTYRKLVLALIEIAHGYEEENSDRHDHFLDLAEQAARDAIAADDSVMSYVTLAQLLLSHAIDEYDEVIALLKQAEARAPSETEAALIESAWGHIAEQQGEKEQALEHYQRAVEHNSQTPGIWYNIGHLQSDLKQEEEAEQSFLRSIEQEPTFTSAYVELASLYWESFNDVAKATAILQQGLEANNDAADILAEYALIEILAMNDLDSAQEFLEQAEEIDPTIPLVSIVRQLFDARKAEERAARKAKRAKSKGHSGKARRR